ncbi:hypothetical protein N7536_011634 [Penicillium majusculum]|uniref:Zn(2)-C6 fungal-type domain-containing protein n=1 Tax=Penicillium solitum TaxID=60172 RepID=A0A1V6QVD4_9EURO|nr:uncharacterized protein PENSOL_c035G05744 [Penicillium solitum]KAJ5680495.1 hypothetical protein N7536_011634 [Penicillium majusculum]OQD93131.1 hypothetical protein PENSOL_c035G05744 [Penicillium solitum]
MLKHPSPTSSSSLETKRSPLPNSKSSIKTNRKNLPTSPPLTSDQNPTPTPKPKPNNQTTTEPPAPPFRSVSACNRCRLRKHRCDQRLPRCESCEKAQVRCVGYDPLTKQEVPRSYVAFLESRVNYLNQVLIDHGIGFKPAIAYDEEETLKMEAGQSPRFESRGLRDARELPEQMQPQTQGMGMGMGARMSRKRKLTQYAEDAIPTRQVKRLAQLNVLLTELLTDGCQHRECSRDPTRGYMRAARRHRVQDDSLEQRLPWSPRSFDSIDHSDSRTTRSVSPVSLHEPYQYPRMAAGHGSSLLSAETVLGSDHGSGVHNTKRQPGIEIDLGDFESEIPNIKPVAEGGEVRKTNVVRRLDVSSRASSPEREGGSSPEPKFDIAADLLRGRRERERANYDLLDEFLVDWAE